jgi:hypothetical protein
VKDGKPRELPTCYAGAVRIRVLLAELPKKDKDKRNRQKKAATDESAEPVLRLEVSPEPKLGWQHLLKMHLSSLTEESGKELPTPLPYSKEETEFESPYYFDPEANARGKASQHSLSKQVCFQVTRPRDGSKVFRTVQGTISGLVLTPPQVLMTMDDILNATGKTASGPDSCSMKIEEVKRSEGGTVTLRFQITPQANPNGGHRTVWMFGPGGQMKLRRGIVIGPGCTSDDKTLTDQELSLVDAKGRSFKVAHSIVNAAGMGDTLEYNVTFEPPAQHTLPARLLYRGQRWHVLDVPFTLKNVPVP